VHGDGARPAADAGRTCAHPRLPPTSADHLLEAERAFLVGDAADATAMHEARRSTRALPAPTGHDLVDVRDQSAASGSSKSPRRPQLSIPMVGPPAAGMSLARRLAGLLPAALAEKTLERAAILSIAGAFSVARSGERVI
jgi:magnesium chelatase family protein